MNQIHDKSRENLIRLLRIRADLAQSTYKLLGEIAKYRSLSDVEHDRLATAAADCVLCEALLDELKSAEPEPESVVHKVLSRGNWLRQHPCYKNPEKRDDLVLRRSHGALAAFGRWLGKRRFTPEELLAMVNPAADEPTLRFARSIQICENTEGRKGVAYNLVFRVSLRYEFDREIDDMGGHVLLPEDEHYDQLLCDGYRGGL